MKTFFDATVSMMQKYLMLVFIVATIFYSCKDDSPTGSNNDPGTGSSGSLNGQWTVDKVQMQQAPSGSSISALMKQALVPFGEVDASFAGDLDITFGSETLNDVTTNLGNFFLWGMKFYGNVGYASGYGLKHSSNGGITWNDITLPQLSLTSYKNIYCLDGSTIFQIYGLSGNIILAKSTNAGQSWITINSNLDFECFNGGINSDLFINSLIGYCLGKQGQDYKFFKTTDGGISWTSIYDWGSSSSVFFSNSRLKFFDEMNGYVYYADKFFKTSNGGLNWTSTQIAPLAFGFNDIFFLNQSTGWIILTEQEPTVYTRNYVYKTNNGGVTWNQLSRVEAGDQVWSTIRFVNDNEGYLRGRNFIFKTSNSGLNWVQYYFPENTYYQNVELINNQPYFFTRTGVMSTPSGAIDSTKWTAQGNLTNSTIQLIARTSDNFQFANGTITRNSNNVTFNCSNYSGGGSRFGSGGGTFSFESGNPIIILDLPNNEKWKIKLKR